MAYLESIDGSVADFTLPREHTSGDSFFDSIPRKAADIEHQRNGVTVSLRAWRTVRTWRAVYNHLTKAQVEALQAFHGLRVFRLHPSWMPSLYYTVKWSNVEFQPEYNSPDSYKLTFAMEEVQS